MVNKVLIRCNSFMSPEVLKSKLKSKLINEAVRKIHSKFATRHTKGYGIKEPFIYLVQLSCKIKFCHVYKVRILLMDI